MARKIYFSFHYDRDIWRVNQVRNSWRYRPGNETQPFVDHAEFEAIRRQSDDAIKRWINEQMVGSTVTCVLIGAETSTRKWVKYEIGRTIERGKGLLGVRIHRLENANNMTDYAGSDPLDEFRRPGLLSPFRPMGISTYDWVGDDGPRNFEAWVEAAAVAAGQ